MRNDGRAAGAARVVAAETVDAGAPLDAAPPGVATDVPICRVKLRIEAAINVELWLPDVSHWNRRYLGAGVGGSAGTFNFKGLARGIDRGFAAASTDSGHTLEQTDWMLDGRAAVNHAHRAVHHMTGASQEILAAFYGTGAEHSYFMGCSGGGREALSRLAVRTTRCTAASSLIRARAGSMSIA